MTLKQAMATSSPSGNLDSLIKLIFKTYINLDLSRVTKESLYLKKVQTAAAIRTWYVTMNEVPHINASLFLFLHIINIQGKRQNANSSFLR